MTVKLFERKHLRRIQGGWELKLEAKVFCSDEWRMETEDGEKKRAYRESFTKLKKQLDEKLDTAIGELIGELKEEPEKTTPKQKRIIKVGRKK